MDTILHQISLMDQVENEQELSEIIHSLLQAIGNYTGADRVYVFDWETDQKDSLSNTFEWCADGVAPEIDNLQAIPVSSMPNWVKRFENKEVIVIHDLEATKNSEPEEYELLKTQEICSLIAVPIYANHQMNGFIGVDNPDLRQNKISITLLSDVGGHLGCVRENLKSTVLLKKALDEATKRSEIIAAIATLYVTIVQANVKERTYELLKGHDLVQKILGQKGKIDDVMERLPTAFAAQEEREKYREFLDFDTLTERLRNTNSVSIEFMGVNGHGQDNGLADGGNLQALFLDDVVHVRLMLHGVHIQVAFGQGLVRLDVVVEFDDFDVKALFGSFFSDFFHDFGMGAGRDADFDFFLVTGGGGIGGRTAAGDGQAGRCNQEGSKDFFYSYLHVNHILSEGEMEVVGQKEKPSCR